MAYEILNNAQVTPHRLHALVRLVKRLPGLEREELLELVSPKSLDEAQSSAKAVLNAAQNCELISQNSDRSGWFLAPTVDEDMTSVAGFRNQMRSVILGATQPNQNHFLFNQYSAWYAVQNENVLRTSPNDYHVQFNEQLHPDSDERAFNSTKRNGWESWAVFLGLGTPLPLGSRREVVIPDARDRVGSVIQELWPADEKEISFREFSELLADRCPELDGGELFERAWNASRSNVRGNQISLMLSNALRGLHAQGIIEISVVSDARDIWNLFPASGYEPSRISLIRYGGMQ